jgi:hypothetical protein
MLVIIVPQTIQLKRQQFAYHLPNGCYYHHTMVSPFFESEEEARAWFTQVFENKE